MTLRRLAPIAALILTSVAARPAAAAGYQTANFSVDAPNADLAKRFGDAAEYFRREKAAEWLGAEMPPWPQRCPLRIIVSPNGAGGATTFTFGQRDGRPAVMQQEMEIRGEVKQLLTSVLPHEVTHTVLAHHFGRAVPRWADEGGSVLSENDDERYSHDVRCRELLNAGRAIRLKVLFKMTEYPRDMIVLYAQGYSVSAWLVEKGGGGTAGRGRLLQFLGLGMSGNSAESWNEAARRVYEIDTVDALEATWLDSLKGSTPSRTAARGSAVASAARPKGDGYAAATGRARSDLRSSASAIPVLDPPVTARGATPESDRPASFAKATAPTGSYAASAPTGVAARPRPYAPDRPLPTLLPPEMPRR